MMKIFATLALLAGLIPAATAESLKAEDAVAYLLVGIQAGGITDLGGMPMIWTQKATGEFVGVGEDAITRMNIKVTATTGCTYDVSGSLVMDSNVVSQYSASYDFAKVSYMSLVGPTTATVVGDGHCTSSSNSICASVFDLAVATDVETYARTYGDFRGVHCP